jgi:hypothetical protein
MSWDSFRKYQEVRVRANGSWMRGHVTEVYQDSVSVLLVRGGMEKVVRVSDLRSITPWSSRKTNQQVNSMSADQQSFDW